MLGTMHRRPLSHRFAHSQLGAFAAALAASLGLFFAADARAQPAGAGGERNDRLAADEVLAVEYWRLALEELFAGIELTAEQQRQVDAIVAEASADRAQGRALQEKMIAAKREGNRERQLALGKELRAVQATFAPNERVDAMRALLAEDQLERFDRNRRLRGDRLVAEEQKEREGRQQLRRRQKAPAPQVPAPPPE